MVDCPVCKGKEIAEKESLETTAYHIMCQRCGEFKLSYSCNSLLKYRDFYHPFSSWIREQNDYGEIPFIVDTKLDEYFQIPDKSIKEKYEKLLKYVKKVKRSIFKGYTLDEADLNLELLAVTWSENNRLLNKLVNKGIYEKHLDILEADEANTYVKFELSFDGIDFLEELGTNNDSNTIFIAFHFTNEMKEQFESTIKNAVADASDNKLEAVRVSSSTTDYDTKIDDELIGMIKSSKAVIADFTGQRNAVYYEAGYAMGLGIPIIWTCKESDAEKLSFDTRQYPHIIWKDKDDLYNQVVNRLKAKIL